MHDQTKNIQKEPMNNPYQSKRIMKRDFWLIPLFFIGMPIIIALVMIPLRMIYESQFGTISKSTLVFFNVIGSVIGQIVTLVIFYFMHRTYIKPLAIKRIKEVKKYIWVLILTYIAMTVVQGIYGALMLLLPKHLQFDNTQNQLILIQLFDFPIAWPLLLIDIVILTPIIEELIFRHLIIHELGKKLGYITGAVLSVLVFAGVHVTQATSPFEFGVYAIMAGALVFVYMYAKRNVAVSIAFHMMINGIGFIGIVGQYMMNHMG
ncbi:CPBP family intramembrane metalloprotease [Staphylococcus simulans]|uniref:CPBP family intramembrane glutamic endopeptidase n=1 Tax=Staphylococcus simulans TaxID=1286 RepID=UPI001E4DE214|nr:type II CAAX endopeptidase family protein [Staphylococcus simulans]MCD8915594.1 CPBP family intramembrane metalloprotease [Staphylococcus simulans]